jgi:hypothetical protein
MFTGIPLAFEPEVILHPAEFAGHLSARFEDDEPASLTTEAVLFSFPSLVSVRVIGIRNDTKGQDGIVLAYYSQGITQGDSLN